jgi:hypothetical protein
VKWRGGKDEQRKNKLEGSREREWRALRTVSSSRLPLPLSTLYVSPRRNLVLDCALHRLRTRPVVKIRARLSSALTGPSVLFLTTVRKEKREAFRLRMSSGTYDKAVFKNPTGGCRCPAGHTRGLLPGRKAKGKELMRLMTFLYKFSVSHPKFSPRVTL